jgi:hypothetical protein
MGQVMFHRPDISLSTTYYRKILTSMSETMRLNRTKKLFNFDLDTELIN